MQMTWRFATCFLATACTGGIFLFIFVVYYSVFNFKWYFSTSHMKLFVIPNFIFQRFEILFCGKKMDKNSLLSTFGLQIRKSGVLNFVIVTKVYIFGQAQVVVSNCHGLIVIGGHVAVGVVKF